MQANVIEDIFGCKTQVTVSFIFRLYSIILLTEFWIKNNGYIVKKI